MNDPHVVSLKYRLVTDETCSYKNPPVVTCKEDDFSLHLEDDIFYVEMCQHFSTEKAARGIVEKYLKAWKIKTILKFGFGEFDFEFEDACIVDRNPSPPGTGTVRLLDITGTVTASESATLCIPRSRSKYPEPPNHFRLSADVETLWQRYQGYCKGREPLQAMAYFCYTVIKLKFNENHTHAVKQLKVSDCVLKKLKRLSSERGDYSTARKAISNLKSLESKEKEWIEEVIKALIQRVAEYDYWIEYGGKTDDILIEIDMSDFPKIS